MAITLAAATSLQEEIIHMRRHIHQLAETGMDLPQTSAYVFERLSAFGYTPTYVAGSGVTAIVGKATPGSKTILLRADMDALPTPEQTDVDYKSENGNMHACGHDLHTAMLLGAAKLLKEQEDALAGTVKLMFQPAEETLQGAKAMVEAGILENPKVDAAIMFHVFAGIPIPAGQFIFLPSGPVSSASDWFEIHIQGQGGHGSMPETTVDPLNVAAHTHIALQAINSREIPSGANAVLTVGEMHGGTTSNVIPDSAYLKGTIRTFDTKIQELIHQRIPQISQGIASSFRAQAETNIRIGCPSVINDAALLQSIKTILRDSFGSEKILDSAQLGMEKMSGSEDFSFVSQKVPSLMMAISAGNSAENPIYQYPQHHPKVQFDEEVLWQGAAAYAIAAENWLATAAPGKAL